MYAVRVLIFSDYHKLIAGLIDMAKALLAMIVGIRLLGRGVFIEALLRTIADEGKRLIA